MRKLKTLIYRVIHLWGWNMSLCGKDGVRTIEKEWNKDYPGYIYPKHYCNKCGIEKTTGMVYPYKPLPADPLLTPK